jgi:hypothetical protein
VTEFKLIIYLSKSSAEFQGLIGECLIHHQLEITCSLQTVGQAVVLAHAAPKIRRTSSTTAPNQIFMFATMERQSAADASKELQQLKREWKKFRLPFDSDFFGDAVEQIPLSIPIAQHPELLPPRRYREWFTSDTVLASLQKWKTMVVDDKSMRIQLMNGFTTD